MRASPLVSVLTSLLLAASASAATVAVAPIRDEKQAEGEALRKQVERGLTDNGVTVISFPALLEAAQTQGFSAADLARPAVLMPVAKAAGAEAVVTGSVDHSTSLDIRVFNLDGVELWSRPIPLKKGKLDKDLPRKIAKAVSAAVASGPPVAGGDTGATPPDQGATPPDQGATTPPDQGMTKPEEGATTPEQGGENSGEQTKPEETPPPPKPRKPAVTNPDDDTATPSKPVKKPKRTKSTEDEIDVDGPPVETKPDTTPAPPYIDVGVGATITSRKYALCPGVTNCSQPGPTPNGNENVPISYTTGTPYGGFSFWAEGFPLPRLVSINDQLTFTAGVFGEFSQSLVLSNAYLDPSSNMQKTFNSSEQRIEAGLTARLYFLALGGTGNVGLNVAIERRAFNVGDNPLITESVRLGTGIGLTGEVPIAGDYFKAMARFTYMPSMNPDVNETTDYGQTGAGSGFDFRGGFTGGYAYFGYSALIDYSSFNDTFTGQGEYTTNGAVATESYITVYLLLHGRF